MLYILNTIPNIELDDDSEVEELENEIVMRFLHYLENKIINGVN